ncbi:MAG: universal stress protein [Candidatus Nanopelagicales bacterium]
MKILVGVVPDASGSDAIALAAVLQKAFNADVVLGNIYPHAAARGGVRKVDAEWLEYLKADARDVLSDVAISTRQRGLQSYETAIHGHPSSGVGLAELAEMVSADLIVIGSAPGSANGRFLIGSTADQLLHGSHVPVALAPAGYRRVQPEALGRMVVAFQDTPESRRALAWAAQHSDGREMTALTVLLRHRVMGSSQAFDGENLIVEQVRREAQESLDEALSELDASATAAITAGDDTVSALQRLDWNGDELLVLASSKGGVLRRVFLGDMTYKLVRATPVPAVVLPRHT